MKQTTHNQKTTSRFKKRCEDAACFGHEKPTPFDEDSSIEAMELPSYEDLGEPTDLSAVEVSLGREQNF